MNQKVDTNLSFDEPINKTKLKVFPEIQPTPEDKLKVNEKFNVIHIANNALNTNNEGDINVVKVNDNIVAIVPFVNTSYATQPTPNTPNKGDIWRQQKMNVYRYLIFTGLLISIAIHGMIRYGTGYNISNLLIQKANAQNINQTPSVAANTVQAPTPDWSRMTFDNMKFSEGGSVEFPNVKDSNPGMKKKRVWSSGQSLGDVMELGDFQDTDFKIESLNLNSISKITGINLDDYNLSDLQLLDWQTLPELVAAIPGLSNLTVDAVPPIADFLSKLSIPNNGSTIGELIQNNPQLKDIELGEYIDLKQYKITSIPGIDTAQLNQFANWQNTTIAKVPGLSSVPFNQFSGIPVPDTTLIGKVDIVLREVENGRWKSISGSYQEGFNVPCYNKQCAHIEVAGSDNLTGAAWMSGKYQQVKGGFGILGSLNGGKEPTGRHPFGKAFKQVLWEPNEANGSITSNMYFRICKRGGFIDLGCSPYFIGPVPFFEYREKDPIILGTPLTVPTKPIQGQP
ncbi:hypothetical protein NIES4071_102300 (plasmid) [Calothrix sp. NIES-4071]|nr:hypothetical protein NIES4071_102300 [Calothrix sp. NIES-4071]BAZ64611.1 hypothetical protein NIES4105_103440 [Calothrix sp. NIES-4105]